MTKRVSLKDIATHVGVSTALVSYVLNGLEKEKRVSPELAKKIREIARDLNYKPNQIARSLRSGSTNTIGLIVADIANPFFGQLARIVEDEAARHNYTVIIGSSDENSLKTASLLETLLDRQVDGFIIVPSEGCDEEIKTLVKRDIPVVLVDRYIPEVSTNYIVLNNFKATYEAVTHLVSKGYKRIVAIAYKTSLVHMQERVRGYREAMMDNQQEEAIQVREIMYNHLTEGVEEGIRALTQGTTKPDALLFLTSTLCISGLYAIQKNQLRVPNDIAVIGFDGSEAFDFFYSPITYIEQPIEQMGKESVRVLLSRINGSNECVQLEFEHRLVQRESCG